jgi:hypothetical protein
MKMRKITLTTLKSFIRKNENQLFLKIKSKFNGMVDGVDEVEDTFRQVQVDKKSKNISTLGIQGIFVDNNSKNYFTKFENNNFEGIEFDNCCGRFILATKIENFK